jgi:hypothetical protein
MPIRITKKSKQGNGLEVEGTAQLVDDTMSIDEPVVLKECRWTARIERGQSLWNVDIQDGDDLRGYIQAELQKRTKRR